MIRFAILTISDRSFMGKRPDASGPALAEIVITHGHSVDITGIVPDDFAAIQQSLIEMSDNPQIDVVLTTGGTGFAPRDITPEATQGILERVAPGIPEAMRASSLRITPHAMLSRGIAGIRQGKLIINLPGSPKAAVENLNVVINILPHAVELIRNQPGAENGHTASISRFEGENNGKP